MERITGSLHDLQKYIETLAQNEDDKLIQDQLLYVFCEASAEGQ